MSYESDVHLTRLFSWAANRIGWAIFLAGIVSLVLGLALGLSDAPAETVVIWLPVANFVAQALYWMNVSAPMPAPELYDFGEEGE